MTRAEKAWFTKFAAASADGKDTQYMQLYECFNKMEVYDEARLKKSFTGKGTKPVSAETFNYISHYLHTLLLKSLYMFHSDDSDYHRLHVWLNEVSILFSKGLYDDCEKLLRRMKKTAKEQERFALLMHILPWQRKLIDALAYRNLKDKDFEALATEEEHVLRQQEQLMRMAHLSNRLVFWQKREGTSKKQTLLQVYDDILTQLKKKPAFLSVKAEVQYFHLRATIWFGKREPENALKDMSHMLGLLLDNPEIVRDEEVRLLGGLNNVLALCVDLKRWDTFDDYLQRMKDLNKKEPFRSNTNFQIRLFERVAAFQLRAFIDRGKTKEAAALIPEIETSMQKWMAEMGGVYLVQIYFHLSVVCVMNSNIHEAHRWLIKLQTSTDQNLRRDLHAYARLTELLVQYELGNTTLLENIVRSAERQFKQLNQLTGYEEIVFRFFRKEVPSFVSKKEQQQGLAKLHAQLKAAVQAGQNTAPVIGKMMEWWCKA